MRTIAALVIAVVAVRAVPAHAQVSIDDVARALGAASVTSLEVTGSGAIHSVGQSAAPGAAWPRFNLKSFTRVVDYGTATIRDEIVRTQALDPPRGGGGQPMRGEARAVFAVSGDHAWNVVGQNVTPAPVALAERQFQLWATPAGSVKAARAVNSPIVGTTHDDGLLMVYLPKDQLLIEADAYNPLPPNAPPPTPAHPGHVNLVENITKQKLGVDRLLPLHGRIVLLAELHGMIGHGQ